MIKTKLVFLTIPLFLFSMSGCTFQDSTSNKNEISNNQLALSNGNSSQEDDSIRSTKIVDEIKKMESEEEKPDLVLPDIDYLSLPTKEKDLDSIKLFQEPLELESNNSIQYTEFGYLTNGKYKDYIFGNARKSFQFSDARTDFYLRVPYEEAIFYISEPAWFPDEEKDRTSIEDFNLPSLEFQEETIIAGYNYITTDGRLYYDNYLLNQIRDYETVTAEDTGYTLYKKGWAFYRIIQDSFYILYQYIPQDEGFKEVIESMSNFDNENYLRYFSMVSYEDGAISTVNGGYTGLFDDRGFIQGKTSKLNFNNLEQIHDGPEINLYKVKEFLGNDDYESQLLQEIWLKYEYDLEYILSLSEKHTRKIPNVSKDQFLTINPLLIQTDNMGEFSVYIRSDLVQPFEA